MRLSTASLLLYFGIAPLAVAEDGLQSITSYFGQYSYTHELCDNEGCIAYTDTAVITPHRDGALVNVILGFDYGHTCTIEDLVGHFENGRLVVGQRNFRGEMEVVEILLKGDALAFHQEQIRQSSEFCGARGSFSAAHPLKKIKEKRSSRKATR